MFDEVKLREVVRLGKAKGRDSWLEKIDYAHALEFRDEQLGLITNWGISRLVVGSKRTAV